MQQKKLILNLSKIKDNKKNIFFIFSIFLSSTFFTFHYGYRGVFPIDSFLIYDAGYKVLNGFHPFKDYWSITGPILDYIQYIFFKLLGVSWFSYVAHSSIVNLSLSVILYLFFLNLGLKKFYCFIYALSVSILAYPSVGTPFMDHHAVIFSLISIMFLFLALKKNQKIYWFFVPIFLFLSFFSKQIPSAYLLFLFLIVIIVYLYLENFKNFDKLKFLILGGVFPILLFFGIFITYDVPFENFLIQYFLYPMSIGEERSSRIVLNLHNTVFQFKFIYLSMTPMIPVIFNLIKKFKQNLEARKDFLLIIFICLSIVIFLYSQILTKNQILIFFLIPFCLGVSHYFCDKYIDVKVFKYFLIIILIISTVKYHLRFNEDKKFMELSNVNLKLASDAKILDISLKGLLWVTPQLPNKSQYELNKLNELKKVLISDNNNKIIMTNYQILPSITQNKKIAPNKWFDTLSVPNKKNKYFPFYKDFFIRKLKEQNINYIYVTGNKKKYLLNIFEKNCFEIKSINKISSKIYINNCY